MSSKGPVAYGGGAKKGDREDRFSNFMRGRIGKAQGRWTWGQFSPLIPVEDLLGLLAKGRDEGTLLPS